MKFTNVTTFFLDDDCSTWARDPRASPINLYLDNGGTLQSNVIAVLDGGVHGIDLPVNNAQGAQGERHRYPPARRERALEVKSP